MYENVFLVVFCDVNIVNTFSYHLGVNIYYILCVSRVTQDFTSFESSESRVIEFTIAVLHILLINTVVKLLNMNNLWVEIRKAVQLSSDSFFAAVKSWKEYSDVHLIKNRLQLCEAIHELLHEYTIHDASFAFNLFTSNGKPVDAALLLPEVQPYLGNEFVQNGDFLTFSRIEESMDKEGFKLSGLFFQNILLRGIAGFDVRTMREANAENRISLLSTLQLILRLPESIGLVSVRLNNKSKPRSLLRECKLKEIQSMDGLRLFQYLTAFLPAPSIPQAHDSTSFTTPPPHVPHSSSATHKRGDRKKRQRDETVEDSSSPSPPSSALNTSSSSETPAVPKQRRVSKTTPKLQPPIVPPLPAGIHAVASLAMTPALSTPNRVARHSASDSLHQLPTHAALPILHDNNSSSTNTAITTKLRTSSLNTTKWNKEHQLVGKRLAGIRALSHSAANGNSKTSASLHTASKLHYGTIIASATTTEAGSAAMNLQSVFRVEWDALSLPVEVLTQSEVLECIQVYNEAEGWSTTHDSVNTLVAAVFPRQPRPLPKMLRGKVISLNNEDLYVGKVTTILFMSLVQYLSFVSAQFSVLHHLVLTLILIPIIFSHNCRWLSTRAPTSCITSNGAMVILRTTGRTS